MSSGTRTVDTFICLCYLRVLMLVLVVLGFFVLVSLLCTRGALQLDGAINIIQVGMQTVIALAEDGSSWMVAYSHLI